MNDSRTLELWKNGQVVRALIRSSMYVAGGMIGLFIGTLIMLVVAIIVTLPALAVLMQLYCQMMWG